MIFVIFFIHDFTLKIVFWYELEADDQHKN
jgi:hypothetical protein